MSELSYRCNVPNCPLWDIPHSHSNDIETTQNVDLKEIVAFNQQQLTHIRMHQMLLQGWIHQLQTDMLNHDRSKFDEDQYLAFVKSRESLNQSETGKDINYQKHLGSEAIQKHIRSEVHHPEYWDEQGFDSMPIRCAIQMYFDWKSRSLQRNTSMDDFWAFNLDKLNKQPTARVVVEHLKREDDIAIGKLAKEAAYDNTNFKNISEILSSIPSLGVIIDNSRILATDDEMELKELHRVISFLEKLADFKFERRQQ